MSESMNESIAIGFSAEERHRLAHLASLSGQSLSEYIRERVLAESRCEEQILRFLSGELSTIARAAKEATAPPALEDATRPAETPQAQRERLVKEVRDSLAEGELEALAQFFKPGFDAGLWPDAATTRKGDSP